MTGGALYGKKFYDGQAPKSAASAARVVPVIVELFAPRSVLDVGCGVGTWCAAMQDAGVAEVAGIDGPWVDARRFAAGADRFVPFDFNNAAKPYAPPLPREKFDLVLTLEFLEHVEPAHAADLVAFMARTADIVVAGAAPPGQGGVNHVNEQWPSYWRALFAAHGFTAFDALRPLIWDLDDVEPWYIQNPVCYFKGEVPAAVRQRAERAAVAHLDDPASLVHPGTLRAKARQLAKRRGLIKRIFG